MGNSPRRRECAGLDAWTTAARPGMSVFRPKPEQGQWNAFGARQHYGYVLGRLDEGDVEDVIGHWAA
jgi:hypothetical protein